MKRIVYVLALGACMTAGATRAAAQTTRRQAGAAQAPASAAASALAALPASDAVMIVDVQRLYKEALPRIYANDAAKLARINADVEEFKTRTGLDLRQFERVAVGVRFTEAASGATKLEPVAIARGTFNAGALVAAGRIAASGKYQAQAYKGKTIYLFSLERQVHLLNLRWTDLAVVVLDRNTLAFGQLERVRAAVDAAAGGARVANDVTALALRDGNAIVGLGGNVPAALTRKLDFLNPEISRSLASVRQFYGSLGADAAGFQMLTVLRTGSPADARTLSDTVEGLKQFAAPLASMRLSGEKAQLVQQLTENTKVLVAGNDVQISLTLADANVATLVRVF